MNAESIIMLIVSAGLIVFLLWFLVALVRENRNSPSRIRKPDRSRSAHAMPGEELLHTYSQSTGGGSTSQKRSQNAALIVIGALFLALPLHAQEGPLQSETAPKLQERVTQLESEVTELRALAKQLQSSSQVPAGGGHSAVVAESVQAAPEQALATAEDRDTLNFLRGTTVNVGVDTYYAFNFNHPVGRVNLLRAYDVLSNNFSLNQASLILDHPPDVAAGRRWGGRLDLQFGQATDTLQGNPSNEPRPDIYRNIFQAYGTYIVPVGKGLNVDFGKWASSLGVEGNYTKDQMNYSRSYWFNFLPFYHMGLRISYPVNDRFSINYWLINGTNQAEATNGFKDELFGFTAKPKTNLTWTVNYYLGQDHPDRVAAANCGPIPIQPGLCFTAIRPAPDGRTHIFDSYAVWQATPKLTLQTEGDYVIQRLWRNTAPDQSSAPSVVKGGAAYARYQFNPKLALAMRAEYLSDGGGLFSGVNQALKETTVTLDYNLGNGFLTRYEWQRNFSNQPSFLTDVQGVLSKQQNTATVGLIWWWGRKEGSW